MESISAGQLVNVMDGGRARDGIVIATARLASLITPSQDADASPRSPAERAVHALELKAWLRTSTGA